MTEDEISSVDLTTWQMERRKVQRMVLQNGHLKSTTSLEQRRLLSMGNSSDALGYFRFLASLGDMWVNVENSTEFIPRVRHKLPKCTKRLFDPS